MFNRNRSIYDRKREYYRASKGKLDIKTVSKEELRLIRKRIIKQRKVDVLKARLITLLVGSIIAFALFKTYSYFQEKSVRIITEDKKAEQKIELSKTIEDYYFFIYEGDHWIEKKQWNNAIFQYKKALELFPENFDANYKLALAYSYKCGFEYEDCEVGIKLTNKLLKDMPNDSALLHIKRTFENK